MKFQECINPWEAGDKYILLIEEGALTEGVRYLLLFSLFLENIFQFND